MYGYLGKVKKKLIGRLHVSLNHDVDKTVLLAGVGRSGTTWLSDIINYNNKYRDIFEPFYNDRVAMCRPLKNKLYLRRTKVDSLVEKISRKILSGEIRNAWCDSQNKRIISSQRIIKDIRINLMLGWIKEYFKEVPIVFIVRNPFAVALSKVKLNWDLDMEEYLSQSELVEDYLGGKIEFIRALDTPFERFIAQWCIENMVALGEMRKEEFHLVFYEDICMNSKNEIMGLFDFLGENYTQEVFKNIGRPSSVSRSDSAIKVDANLINSWKKHCSDENLEAGMRVMRMFSMDDIYDEMGLPNKDKLLNRCCI